MYLNAIFPFGIPNENQRQDGGILSGGADLLFGELSNAERIFWHWRNGGDVSQRLDDPKFLKVVKEHFV